MSLRKTWQLTDTLRASRDLPQHAVRAGDYLLPEPDGGALMVRRLSPAVHNALLRATAEDGDGLPTQDGDVQEPRG